MHFFVIYYTTELGKSLIPVIQALEDWGDGYFKYLGLPNPCEEKEDV